MGKRKIRFALLISLLFAFVIVLTSCNGLGSNNQTSTTTGGGVQTTTEVPTSTTQKGDTPTTTSRANVEPTTTTTTEAEPSSNPVPTITTQLIQSARTIKIVQIEGEATVTDEYETSECFRGMNLYDGDKIEVKANSVLVIKFDEDKYVYLGENTTINLKSEGENKYKTNVFVTSGKVLAEIQKPLDQDEEFFLSSNNSVMAVRGTVFGIQVAKVGAEIVQTYSVYRGVTELYVFDNKLGNLVSGKLTDITNSKYEITIPEEDVLDDDEEYNEIVDNWLTDVSNEFENEEGANQELNEVEITVGTPSESDYQEIIDTIGDNTDTPVTYSNIVYNADGYYGQYDGLAHSITINVETEGAKIQYKTSVDGEYTDELPEFTTPGYYRTYYKITCDGYYDKEDYGIVQISKADLTIEYKDNITIPGLVAGMDINTALGKINLSDFIEINGATADSEELANSTFDANGNLEMGTATYELNVVIPDSISEYYNPAKAEISLTSYEVKLVDTDSINDGYLNIDGISSFNKYNGVLADDLFGNAIFTVGNSELYYDDVTFNYDYKTEGYFELKDGKNTVNVVIDCGDYEINTEVYFTYYDSRTIFELTITVDDILVSALGDDCYYYNTSNLTATDGKYQISTATLATNFGISTFSGYMNLPTDVVDANSTNYTVSSSNLLEFEDGVMADIEFVVFPDDTTSGVRKIISVYFSQTPPSNFPTYSLENNLTYYPGTIFDFVISESPVQYSLDGITYQDELSVDELGEVDIYFKVGTTIVTKGKSTVLITTGGITTDALNMISDNISLLSNDGRTLTYIYYAGGEANNETMLLTSSDGSTISPTIDTYNIYTGIVKNAKYYNNLTNEEMTVDVSVTPMQNGVADFDYEVTAEGFVPLTGSVHFVYPYEAQIYDGTGPKPEPGGSLTENVNSIHLSVVNPIDRTVSLSDVDRVYASRIVYSTEDMDADYTVLYSIDEGATWTEETPVFTQAGEYKVYIIYTTTYESESAIITSDLTIVAVQNITITE